MSFVGNGHPRSSDLQRLHGHRERGDLKKGCVSLCVPVFPANLGFEFIFLFPVLTGKSKHSPIPVGLSSSIWEYTPGAALCLHSSHTDEVLPTSSVAHKSLQEPKDVSTLSMPVISQQIEDR